MINSKHIVGLVIILVLPFCTLYAQRQLSHSNSFEYLLKDYNPGMFDTLINLESTDRLQKVTGTNKRTPAFILTDTSKSIISYNVSKLRFWNDSFLSAHAIDKRYWQSSNDMLEWIMASLPSSKAMEDQKPDSVFKYFSQLNNSLLAYARSNDSVIGRIDVLERVFNHIMDKSKIRKIKRAERTQHFINGESHLTVLAELRLGYSKMQLNRAGTSIPTISEYNTQISAGLTPFFNYRHRVNPQLQIGVSTNSIIVSENNIGSEDISFKSIFLAVGAEITVMKWNSSKFHWRLTVPIQMQLDKPITYTYVNHSGVTNYALSPSGQDSELDRLKEIYYGPFFKIRCEMLPKARNSSLSVGLFIYSNMGDIFDPNFSDKQGFKPFSNLNSTLYNYGILLSYALY